MPEIREVDVDDEAALHEWWATGREAAADRAYDVYPAWEHSRLALAEQSAERDLTLVGAYRDDAMVGIAVILGVAVWVALLKSGIDPVIAGLAVGLITSSYPPARVDLERVVERTRSFREQPTPQLARSAQQAVASAISLSRWTVRLGRAWICSTR